MLFSLMQKFETASCSTNKSLSVVRHAVNGRILADEIFEFLRKMAVDGPWYSFHNINFRAINPSELPKPRYPCKADLPPAVDEEEEDSEGEDEE